MPVRLQAAIRDGWKQEDNKRFGQCAEIRFRDPTTDKCMFRWAPTLEDEEFIINFFTWLKEYDKKHKDIYEHVQKIDGAESLSAGSCERIYKDG